MLTGVLKKIKGKLLDLNYLRGVSWHTLLVPFGSSVLNTDKVVSGTGRLAGFNAVTKSLISKSSYILSFHLLNMTSL